MANVDTNTLCKERADLILKKTHSDSTKKFSETDIINMLEFFYLQHICYVWWTCFSTDSRHTNGYNCSPLIADLFLYSYEAHFMQGFLKKNEMKIARSFNFTFRYIDDVLSLNNSRFCEFVDRIYPIELEIEDTTDAERST